MAHENFFDAKPPAPREPRLGVPPPHVNGHDDEYYASLLASAVEEGNRGEPAYEPPHSVPPAPMPLLWFNDIEPSLDANDFVQGLLMAQSSVVVYGQSNSGKTFWTTDLALCVAAGREWNGRRVEQGGVIYCVLEGGIGFRNRVAAWKDEHAPGYALPFAAIPCAMNLLSPDGDTDRLVASIQSAATMIEVPIRLVVIDTLARALAGGNENAPDDMGLLVANMDTIRQQTGATVLFVHHSGKDEAKGARGHSSLQAAIDTEIEVVDTTINGIRTAQVVKQRDLAKGDVFEFTLRVVDLGKNPHAEPVTTCIVDASTQPHQPADASKLAIRHLKGPAKRAYELLLNLITDSGQAGYAGVPLGILSVPEKWWRERFYEGAMPGDTDAAKEKAFRRAADALLTQHIVGMENRRVWVTSYSNGDVP